MLKATLYILLALSLLALLKTVFTQPGKPIIISMDLPVNQLAINTANSKAFFDMVNDPLPEYRQESK